MAAHSATLWRRCNASSLCLGCGDSLSEVANCELPPASPFDHPPHPAQLGTHAQFHTDVSQRAHTALVRASGRAASLYQDPATPSFLLTMSVRKKRAQKTVTARLESKTESRKAPVRCTASLMLGY